jgi:hypothetical protein
MNISSNNEPDGKEERRIIAHSDNAFDVQDAKIFPRLFPLNQHFVLKICGANVHPSKIMRI